MGSHKIGKYERLRAPTNQARVYRSPFPPLPCVWCKLPP